MLKEKVALVTGASSGIGRAVAVAMAQNGAYISIVGRSEEELQKVSAQIGKSGGRARSIVGDLTASEDCERFLKDTLNHYGRLDILVNCAGTLTTGTIENTSLSDFRSELAINLDAVFNMMRLAAPHLIETKGNIVNVSSVTGLRAFPGVLPYCVSKAAVDQLTRCSALELAPKGVRVNAVNPGVTVTNLHRRGGMDEQKYQAFLERSKTTHPLGRVGTPEEIAHLVTFLASERAGWITGACYAIDGGRHQTCAR
jgi:NAD(P)-dependent dehydrogenase (short-subunit alcohol dehydrogenase family)